MTHEERNELLEASATAMGIPWDVDLPKGGIRYHPREGIYLNLRKYWNPLDNNEDAFELAMKLFLVVTREPDIIWVRSIYSQETTSQNYSGKPDDYLIAARLSITKAAAKVGNRMGYKRNNHVQNSD